MNDYLPPVYDEPKTDINGNTITTWQGEKVYHDVLRGNYTINPLSGQRESC